MGTVVFTGVAEKDGNQFTALCTELDVATCGDTVDQALDNLGDAIEVYLNALDEVGTLTKVFKERGIEVIQDMPAAENVLVSIPPDKTVRAYPRTVPALVAV